MPKKILIINPFGVGDVLFSMPLILAIKKIYPESYIGYICNLKTQDIVRINPDIDEVFVFERDEYRIAWEKSKTYAIRKFFGFWSEIKKRDFELVFDLSLGKEYAFMCWHIGIKERRGFDYKNRGRFLTHRIRFDGFNNMPVADYYLELLRSFEGLPADFNPEDVFSKLKVLPDSYIEDFLKNSGIKDGDLLVGLAPGGGISFGKNDKSKRRWPAENFAELGEKVSDMFNAKIILLWGPGDEDAADQVIEGMKKIPIVPPETTLSQMAALCGRCNIVVCSEGGPLHIAHSQGVKTISIFGPVDERVYGPYPRTKNSIVLFSERPCRPCYKQFKMPSCDTRECLEDVSVDRVFEVVKKIIESDFIVPAKDN